MRARFPRDAREGAGEATGERVREVDVEKKECGTVIAPSGVCGASN